MIDTAIHREFEEAMRVRGIDPPSGGAIADGRIHRANTTGRNGKGDASYCLYPDEPYAGWMENFQDGLGVEVWKANGTGRRPTEADRAAWEEIRRGREAEELVAVLHKNRNEVSDMSKTLLETRKEQLEKLEGAFENIKWMKNRTPQQEQLYCELATGIPVIKEEIAVLEGKSPDPARPLTLQGFGGGSRALDAGGATTGGFDGVGDFMQALYRRSKGEGMDARLEPLRITAAAIGGTVPSSGGFAVPEQFVVRAFEDLADTVLLAACDKVTMTSDKLNIPAFVDDDHNSTAPFGITWDTIPESGSFGDYQALSFKKLNLQAHKSGALFAASNEWLADAHPAMRQRLESIFAQSLRWYVEKLLWTGTGSGQALGALNGDGALSIPKESGQQADTIITENIIKMWARLRPGSHGRAIFCANPTTFPMLATLSIAIGTGGSVVSLLQPSGIAGGPATSILGRPLFLSEHLPALGNAGDICLLDPMLYVLGDRKQITMDASPHIRFQYDETAFRCQVRFDGQPALNAVLTPENGDTVAWLVRIAERA